MSKENYLSILKGSRKTQAIGVGLGIGLIGAIALALRYSFRKHERPAALDVLSPEVFSTRVHTTSGGEIIYHTSGEGEPLVFLHGIYVGASSFEWSRVYPAFTSRYTVIAPDLIGFGESERPEQALDLRDHVSVLVELLHHFCNGVQPVIVASGVSAKIALMLASQHPEFPKKLLLWLPLGVRQLLRKKTAREAIGVSRLPWLRSLAWKSYLASPEFLHRWISQIGFEDRDAADEEVTSVLATCASLYRAEKAIWAFLQGSFAEDLSPRLRDVSCPVSILWPENSQLSDATHAESLRAELPRATLDYLPVRGMLAPLRDPIRFQRAIEAQLATFGEVSDELRKT